LLFMIILALLITISSKHHQQVIEWYKIP